MATIFPTIENITRLKEKPTAGEWYLINYLKDHLADDIEIYFQPFLNGDRPDIILMKKGVGVAIIEVKDWNFNSYTVNKDNKWCLKYDGKIIKSPFQQVYNYKDNMFNLHINGLLEKKLKDTRFYGRIRPFVYFHNMSNTNLRSIYGQTLNYYRDLKQTYHNEFKNKQINHKQYTEKLDYLKQKLKKINRDLDYVAITSQSLHKITLPYGVSELFTDDIYREFQRYLQPPYHAKEESKKIAYTKTQERLSISEAVHMKIKGVAGSGKTTVIAKRAVNAHKRHGERVLILTFNIALINYIHDRISDVREGFSWGCFYIDNYHAFFRKAADQIEAEIDFSNFSIYSNTNLFKNYHSEILKYNTILIDEIQDYKIEWMKIIRDNFLLPDGEIVLFGDEKQNIYERSLDVENKISVPNGFGKWKFLSKSIRHQGDGGRVLNLTKKFQQAFFRGKYVIDEDEKLPTQSFLSLEIFHASNINDLADEKDTIKLNTATEITNDIFKNIKENNIHPNNVCILSSRIDLLREVDYQIRTVFNEKTVTTFETKEMYAKIQNDYKNKPAGNSNVEKELEKIRRNKKIHFHLNSGVVKLSTVHSFKGSDSQTVFLILDQKDKEEMVYTAITRSKFNLMVHLPKSSRFNEFFAKELTTTNSNDAQEKNALFASLKDSVSLKKVITIDYEVHGKIRRFNNVKPYKILFMHDNYYLACEIDSEYKFSMFRISKIRHFIDAEESFLYNIDIQNFVSDIQTPFARYRENYQDFVIKVIVEVCKSKAHFFESKKFLSSQKKEAITENGNLRLSFTVTQELEIEELIKAWLPYIKVIEPLSLDEKIKADIKRYLIE